MFNPSDVIPHHLTGRESSRETHPFSCGQGTSALTQPMPSSTISSSNRQHLEENCQLSASMSHKRQGSMPPMDPIKRSISVS